MKTLAAVVLAVLIAPPATAQVRRPPPPPPRRPVTPLPPDPKLSVRAFGLFMEQQFTAKTTFDAAFGRANQMFFGGGLQLAFRSGLFTELVVSRFQKTGQRAFLDTDTGKVYRLGIPLTTTITPFEATFGYRFRPVRHPRLRPYIAGGVGSYVFTENSSTDTADNLDTRHLGYLVNGGLEVRVRRLIGIASDAQYTTVTGILGSAGLSKDVKDTDAGGVAVRVKLIIGR